MHRFFSDSGSDALLEILRQSGDATAIYTGPEFRIRFVNDAMLTIWGKDRSVHGLTFSGALPEMDGQPFSGILNEVLNTGKIFEARDMAATLKINEVLVTSYFDFIFKPIGDEKGKIHSILHTAVDVTERMHAWKLVREKEDREQQINEELMAANEEYHVTNEELNETNNRLIKSITQKKELEEILRSSEKRMQDILETMAEGMGITDVDGQMIYANPMAQQILGLSESDIKDRTFDDPRWQNLRLDGTPLPSEEHPMSIMKKTGKPVYDHEIGVQPPGRDVFYISINAAPIFDKDGRFAGGIATFTDVTARRMILQGKDDFISIASHELKTPVTALKASLQLLQRSHHKLPDEARTKLLSKAMKSLEKLSQLIADLLDTSRMDQGYVKPEKKAFTFRQLLEDCCSDLIQQTDASIVFEGDISKTIEADPQQIGQVIINFVTNAIKYAPDSGIIINVETTEYNGLKISVIDQGPGIPQDKLAHLFKRYYRTDYQGQKFTGLGLGLYISAEIIKNHGGQIGVESEISKGSRFWFTLPF